MAKPKKPARKATRKPAPRIQIEAELTPAQVKQLSKLFTERGVSEVKIPISSGAIIKMRTD